jgi:anti-sigma-K factor RskA
MSTDIHALAGAYALDAVNDLERVEFSRHLAECETCALEVAEMRTTAARLADSTWSAAPPRLRENVLHQVSRTRQARPGRPGRPNPVEERSTRPGRWRRWTVAAAAACILAAGAAVGTFVLQEQRVGDQRQQADALRDQLAGMESVMAAADAKARQVKVSGGGQVAVICSKSQDAGVVTLAGLSQPGPDKAYELWVVDDSGPTPARVLHAGANAGTHLITGVRGCEAVGVSLEPAGGSKTPTKVVAEVKLP